MTSARNQPLTTDDIARLAPSALAREASDGMSQRYTYIPTIDVIDGMREAGFLPFRATQSAPAIPPAASTPQHMIRFRTPIPCPLWPSAIHWSKSFSLIPTTAPALTNSWPESFALSAGTGWWLER